MVVGFNKSVDFLKNYKSEQEVGDQLFYVTFLNTFTYYQTSTHEWEKK